MTSPNSKDTEKTYNKFINLNKSPMNTNNKSDLIQNIPKLNLHDGFNSERNTKFTKKPKIININFDKQSFSPSNNNLDIDNEKKYDTDNNFPVKSHNNIFDFYDIDKLDTNNTTSLESKNLSSFSNNKKCMINKSVRKKRIINLKSFINDRKNKANKKLSSSKLISILNKVYTQYLLKISFQKLIEFQCFNKTLIQKNNCKSKNSENKIINLINRNVDNKEELITNKFPIIKDKPKYNNECNNYHNLNNNSDLNFYNNYFYDIEQFSARYNQEKEERLFNISKYRPTNISFVINNFSNNNFFNNINKEFKIIEHQCKINNKNESQIFMYKKYYGNIEAINEEENESEENKNRKSSRRNENDSVSDNISIEDNIDYSVKKLLLNIKFNKNKTILKDKNPRIYKINPPIPDKIKFDIKSSIYITSQISKIESIRNHYLKKGNKDSKQEYIIKNKYKYENLKKNENINKSYTLFSRRRKEKDETRLKSESKEKIKNNGIVTDISSQIDEKGFNIVFSIIVFAIFVFVFLSKNLKIEK